MRFVVWLVLVALGVYVWIRLNRRLFRDALTPLNVLLFSWFGPLALTTLQLSGLQRPWAVETWLVVGWTSFVLVAVSVASATRIPRRASLFDEADRRQLHQMWAAPEFLAVLVPVYAVAYLAYLYNEFITNPVGIPALAYIRDPLLAREPWHRWGKEGGASAAGLVSNLAPLLLPSLYLASWHVRSRLMRWALWFAIAAYPTMAILKLSRIDVITSVAALAMAEWYRRAATPKVRKVVRPRRRFLRAALVGGLVLALAPLSNEFLRLRANVEVAETFFERTLDFQVKLPPVLQGLVLEGYAYFALPFENLADWVPRYSGPDVPGVGMLRPAYSLLGAGRDIDTMTQTAIGDYRLWPINTFPFVTLPYFEGGAVAVAIVPILIALLVNWFYVRMRSAPTPLRLALYINCMFGWLLLFSTNGFAVLTFYLNIASLIGLYTGIELLSALRAAAAHSRQRHAAA